MSFSKYDSKLTLNSLLQTPEHQFFDRKSANIKIPKLAEAIVGFANADGGLLAI